MTANRLLTDEEICKAIDYVSLNEWGRKEYGAVAKAQLEKVKSLIEAKDAEIKKLEADRNSWCNTAIGLGIKLKSEGKGK